MKTMKIEQLWSSLEAHELMVIDRCTDRSIQQFLQTQMVKKYKHERKYNKKGGGFCINQSTKKKNYKRKMHCYDCEKYWHFTNKCCHNKDGKKNQKSDEGAHKAHDDTELMMMTMI